MAASGTAFLPWKRKRRKAKARGILQAPEIQSMYSLNMPISKIRTKVREEFEKHKYVNQLAVVDVLLFQGHSEFQVRIRISNCQDFHARSGIEWQDG